MINYMTHKEIDKEAWDGCIKRSVTPLPYGLSWWLDVVNPSWEALVQDNYASVMPLTQNSRFGIKYLRQPWFTQQLGIFSGHVPEKDEISRFIDSIPASIQYAEIQLNHANNLISTGYTLNFRVDHILDLSPGYINLESNYHRNCRRNIQKALHAGLYVRQGPGPSVFAGFTERNLDRTLSRHKGLFAILPAIVQASLDRCTGSVYGVYDRSEELNAAGWFVDYSGRCLFMVCASTPTGKKNQAMSLLVDHVIREKACTETVFDFTGSEMPGVSYFNSGFGATRQMYPLLKINRLPWFLRMFKR